MVKETIKKAGNINAAHTAIILNAKGKQIGTCMDTPNNIAYALGMSAEGVKAQTPFNGVYHKKDLLGRFDRMTAEDRSYHAQFIELN